MNSTDAVMGFACTKCHKDKSKCSSCEIYLLELKISSLVDVSIVASRLKKLMTEANMTQQGLADIAGTTRQSISTYLNEQAVPPVKALVRLSLHFHVSIDWLLGTSDVRSFKYTPKTLADITGLSESACETLLSGTPDRQFISSLLIKPELLEAMKSLCEKAGEVK